MVAFQAPALMKQRARTSLVAGSGITSGRSSAKDLSVNRHRHDGIGGMQRNQEINRQR